MPPRGASASGHRGPHRCVLAGGACDCCRKLLLTPDLTTKRALLIWLRKCCAGHVCSIFFPQASFRRTSAISLRRSGNKSQRFAECEGYNRTILVRAVSEQLLLSCVVASREMEFLTCLSRAIVFLIHYGLPCLLKSLIYRRTLQSMISRGQTNA